MEATLSKRERLVSKILIDKLFGDTASRSAVDYPLRTVYHLRQRQEGDEPVQMLISVPKKKFHHAVDRNRVKRQIREAYRHQKQQLYTALPGDKALLIAFVWMAGSHVATDTVAKKTKRLLAHITGNLSNCCQVFSHGC